VDGMKKNQMVLNLRQNVFVGKIKGRNKMLIWIPEKDFLMDDGKRSFTTGKAYIGKLIELDPDDKVLIFIDDDNDEHYMELSDL